MSTVTYFVDNTQPLECRPNIISLNAVEIDFTKRPCAAADVVQVMKIAKGSLVTKVSVIVKTAQGGTCTATVGDGAGANSWDASTNLNAAANTATYSAAGTDAYAHGKFYAAEDTIDLVLGHTTDAAIIVVTAELSVPHGLPA